MALVVFKLALVDSAITLSQNAVAITLALEVRALESGAICPLVERLAFELVVMEASSVETAICECHGALSLLQTIVETAFIFVPSWVDQSALSLHLAVYPVAIILCSILL